MKPSDSPSSQASNQILKQASSLILLIGVSACTTTPKLANKPTHSPPTKTVTATSPQKSTQTSSMNKQVWILFYDPQIIDLNTLTQALKNTGSDVIYQYNNFNALAFSGDTNSKQTLEKIKGVLAIHPDQKLQLD